MAASEMTDEDLEKMAMEEILKETKRNSERAKEFGSLGWQNPRKTANKRFLSNMLVSTLRNPLQKSRHDVDSKKEKMEPGQSKEHGGPRRHSDIEWRRKFSESDECLENKKKPKISDRERSRSSEKQSKEKIHRSEKISKESLDSSLRGERSSKFSSRKNGGNQHYSCKEASSRNHYKVRSGSWDERGEKRKASAVGSRGGALEDHNDLYHDAYMEYIQNHGKHMKYYEKMEKRELQEGSAKFCDEGKKCYTESRMNKKSKKKRKKSTACDDNFSSDSSEYEEECCERNLQGICGERTQKSNCNNSKQKSEKNTKSKTISEMQNVCSQEDKKTYLNGQNDCATQFCSMLKGNNSELTEIHPSQTGTFLHEKKSKHKKYKHKSKKRKKNKEQER